MTTENSEGSKPPTLPSFEDLVVPRRPLGIPYIEGDDYDAQALLEANDLSLATEQLIAILDVDIGIFQAAAARVLGARKERAAIERLLVLAKDDFAEETARVQAAYALLRMDEPAGRELLVQLLSYPVETSPAPLQAAAALASLGDQQGYELVRKALDSPNALTAMVACKQLYAFVPLDSYPLTDGKRVDIYEAFGRALLRDERNIAGEALAQLEELDTIQAQALIGEHSDRDK